MEGALSLNNCLSYGLAAALPGPYADAFFEREYEKFLPSPISPVLPPLMIA